MSKKGVLIRLDDIKINKENFRHPPLKNEMEAIHYLITEDYNSYLTLAKEMQKDCRTFNALILEKNNEMILMDANRRISVLKIFEDPSLIPTEKEYDDLRNLCEAKGSLGIKSIYADIYYDFDEEDKENLMNALDELHINDNHTRKDWNALSQYRASTFIGSVIKHPWIKTLEFYGYTDKEIIQMTYKKSDIFSRILKKKKLCIDSSGKMNIKNDEEVIRKICEVVKECNYNLNGKSVNVNTRSSGKIFEDIIEDLIQKYSTGQISFDFSDLTGNKEKEHEVESKKENDKLQKLIPFGVDKSDVNQKKSNVLSLGRDVERRKTVISDKQKKELSKTGNSQVNEIAYELSKLNIECYVICAPILLRSFLQYAFEWYISNNDINSGANSGLQSEIDAVVNDMFLKKEITKEEKGRVKALIKNVNVINLLNDVTHNFESKPFPKSILIDLYDAVHPLIKVIYKQK